MSRFVRLEIQRLRMRAEQIDRTLSQELETTPPVEAQNKSSESGEISQSTYFGLNIELDGLRVKYKQEQHRKEQLHRSISKLLESSKTQLSQMIESSVVLTGNKQADLRLRLVDFEEQFSRRQANSEVSIRKWICQFMTKMHFDPPLHQSLEVFIAKQNLTTRLAAYCKPLMEIIDTKSCQIWEKYLSTLERLKATPVETNSDNLYQSNNEAQDRKKILREMYTQLLSLDAELIATKESILSVEELLESQEEVEGIQKIMSNKNISQKTALVRKQQLIAMFKSEKQQILEAIKYLGYKLTKQLPTPKNISSPVMKQMRSVQLDTSDLKAATRSVRSPKGLYRKGSSRK